VKELVRLVVFVAVAVAVGGHTCASAGVTTAAVSPLHVYDLLGPNLRPSVPIGGTLSAVAGFGVAAKAEVRWVDEAAAMSDDAAKYQAGAIGARSNAVTRAGQAPELYGVRFDGFDDLAGVLIDRKVAVTTFAKSQRQALRQSEALARGGYRGLWEVPNSAQAARAQRMFSQLGISNIDVAVVPR
jgi:filamentous hemagglutinin